MKFLISLFFFQTIVFALPKQVDIYFLSAAKKQSLLFENKIFQSVAYTEPECVETEAGCFHPQLGLIKSAPKLKEEVQRELKTINALEANLIDCKDGNYFDIYCGKAKPLESNKDVDYEVWIDTSSSLRQFDWDDDPQRCQRRTFIERFKMKCQLEVKVFDTSIKQMGDLSTLCVNYGLNDQNRLISWIENSAADKLIIVTDIDEASRKIRDYLFKIGANIYGADYGDISGEKLLDVISKYETSCQKKK